MSRQSTKNKKYALRKIGKFFGSCVVATVITLGGAAIMAPNVTVYASDTTADGEADIDSLSDSNAGYEVIIPKGKKYIRNDEIESHTPVLKEEGYNGRSFILPKEGEEGYFFDHPMSEVFTKLYDKDNDGNVDDEYKNPEPVDNSHAGETIDGATVPYRSEINPKYPHVVDSGLTGDSLNAPGVWKYNPDGKYAPSDGVINDQDTIVVARKPIKVDENADDNVVKEDGSVVLSYPYRIHVNEGDHIDKKDDVYEVGTKPKVERTPIPFETTYKRDDSVPEGTEEEVTAGKNGETVKKTTYELNPTTGEVTPNEPTSETTNPVTRVVKKGTQPKVEKTPIPFETTYERDDSVPEGTEEEVTAGVNGETVKTTTYELNPTTGEVTANEPTTTTTNPVTKVVKRGTQPKVEKTPIPFETTY
ncbi:G5 domain-containing protein, partial [Streptococcus mitis]|uniref:G5 domain-containing protein n=1 Tax=Streptococcus mitis TaxID=28037 RepID=UPI0018C86A0D